MSGIVYLFLYLQLIDCATADSGAVVTPPNVHLQEGEPGRLPCNYSRPASLLFWTKGNTVSEAKVILSSDIPSTGELSGPGAVEGRFDISGFSLLILRVKGEDEGRYFCEITDKSTGEVFRSHTDVTTGKNPVVLSVSTQDDIELTSGKDALLPCSFPLPVSAVYWKKGESRENADDIIILDRSYGELSGPGFDSGQFVIRDDFSLVIRTVQEEDSGRYFCEVVSSGTGSRYDGFTDVTIIDPPAFYIDQCKDTAFIEDDKVCSVNVPSSEEHISADCLVIGAKGHVSIVWSINDTASGIISSTSVRSDNVANLTATIRQNVDSIPDGGRLTCTADVNNGSYRSKITVMTVVPTLPSSPASVKSDSFRVKVTVVIAIAASLVVIAVVAIILYSYRRHQDGDKEDEWKQGQTDPFDESLPSWASTTDQRVRIRGKRGATYQPITIPLRFERTKDKYPNKVALAVKDSIDDLEWKVWTYQQYWDECKKVAKALIQLKIKKHQTVGICGLNSPEWVMTYMGSIMAGCVAVGLSTEFSVEEFWQVVDDCKPDIIVMGNMTEFGDFTARRGSRLYPKHIVFYSQQQDGQEFSTTDGYTVYSWEKFVELSADVHDHLLKTAMDALSPNQCCSITYPSKFSKNSKGCMMSHDNFTWLSRQCVAALNIAKTKGRLASYLPLHRVVFQLFDIMVSLSSAGTTYFMSNEDVQSKYLMAFIKLVRPTTFLFIPHVLDNIKEEVESVEQGYSTVKQYMVKWSKRIGLTGTNSKWESKPWGWTLANFLLFRKIRSKLGMNKCKCCLSSGSKLRRETLDFFLGLGLPIYDMYGMSESTGVLTSCLPDSVRSGSVGKTFSDSNIIVHNSDTAGNGEMCFYDRNLFMGYLNEENKTRSSLTAQGLFVTGDIGYRDSDGFLYLIGKTEDKITIKNDHHIHPGPVEEAVKKTPVISDCMLIGEKRPYLTLIATLKPKKQKKKKQRNDETEALMPEEDLIKAKKEIKSVIHDYNMSVGASRQQVKVCFLLNKEFSPENGELSNLYKTKNRKTIEAKYGTEIDRIYQTYETRPAGLHIMTRNEQTTRDESETG